ncbi:MAG TPA: hypothetical protein VJQ51_02140, partial [Burkholderiales bacterium]|nr:hypothetical protein [Burkholderiales bacterium]
MDAKSGALDAIFDAPPFITPLQRTMKSRLVSPHGGANLKPLLLEGPALQEEKKRAQSLPRIRVSSREKGDLIMLGIGGFTP